MHANVNPFYVQLTRRLLASYTVCKLYMLTVSSNEVFSTKIFQQMNVSLSYLICQDIEFNSWKIKRFYKKVSLLHIVYCA